MTNDQSGDPVVTSTLARLGHTLAVRAESPEHLGCLEVFSDILDMGPGQMPMLLNVVVARDGSAQILTIGNPPPGLTLQIDQNLRVDMTQLHYGETRHNGSDPDTD